MKKIFKNYKFIKYIFATIISFSLILAVWEFSVDFFHVSQIVLVPPSKIWPAIVENQDIFLRELFFTSYEVLVGWFIGNLIAIIFATAIYNFKNISQTLISISVVINAIPIIALAAILGGIVGTDQGGKAILVALLCFFPMFISSLTGFTRIDPGYENLFHIYATNPVKRYFNLVLPNGLPYIFQSLKVNVITAIFAGIVGEFFGAHGGIGNLILAKKGLYDLPMVWGAIFYIIIASCLFYFVVYTAEKLIVYWRR